MAVNKFGQVQGVLLSVDKFGRSSHQKEGGGAVKLTMQNNYDMLGRTVTNVGTPIHNSDAVNKGFLMNTIKNLEQNLNMSLLNFTKKNEAVEALKKSVNSEIEVLRLVTTRNFKSQLESVQEELEKLEKRINRTVENQKLELIARMNESLIGLHNKLQKND